MNKNILIGLLVVAIAVVIGGYFLFRNAGSPNSVPNATSTPSEATSTPSTTPVSNPNPALQPGVPAVQTYQNLMPSNSTVIVDGRVNPNGASTEYWYEYGEGAALGLRTSSQVIGSGFNYIPAPAYITGLKANTIYYFRLSAKNQYGTVQGTTYSFKTNSNPPPQGSVPGAVTVAATNVGTATATLNGQVSPKGSATAYWFEYGDTTNMGGVTALQSAGSGTGLVNVTVPLAGLKPLTRYYFRLNAQNQYGTVTGTVLNFTTKGLPPAGQPTVHTDSATKIATSSVVFNGRVSPNGAQTTYWFEYGTDPLLTDIIGAVTPIQSLSSGTAVPVSADATGLSRNTKYFYRLDARNSYGTVKGNIVSFKTKP